MNSKLFDERANINVADPMSDAENHKIGGCSGVQNSYM